jgi:hypothetical protein
MGKHRMKLTNKDILLIMDHLAKGFTDAVWRKDPKRAESTYEVYQTIGQAMGESHIVLEYFVKYLPTKDSTDAKPNEPVTFKNSGSKS